MNEFFRRAHMVQKLKHPFRVGQETYDLFGGPVRKLTDLLGRLENRLTFQGRSKLADPERSVK